MISLPPGCTVNYSIRITVDELTDSMIEWYKMIGGKITTDSWYNNKGSVVTISLVQYNSKPSHRMQDGTKVTLLHFLGTDASTASMFIMKYAEHIINHNLKEINELHY